MASRRTTFRILVGCIVAAVLGLVTVQWYLLRQAMELKDQAFRRNVLAALNTVAQKLEAGEAYHGVLGIGLSAKLPDPGDEERSPGLPGNRDTIAHTVTIRAMPLQAAGNTVYYSVKSPQRVRLQLYDLDAGHDTVIVDTFKTAGVYEAHVNRPAQGSYFFRYTADSSQFYLHFSNTQSNATPPFTVNGRERQALVNRVVDRLIVGEQQPIERRIKTGQLDSLLQTSLRDAGITLNFARGVYAHQDSTLKLATPGRYHDELSASDLRARLFPTDLLSPRNDLVVYFPEKTTFLLTQIGPLLGASAILTLIIVFGFTYSLRTIVAQRRMARLMTDFVNNMTHEFKTPISTVALAVEAIRKPEVLEKPEKVLRFNAVIHDENVRMRMQVEKILQMAVLERGEYELHVEPVDVHELLRRVASGVALQVEHRGGSLTLDTEAKDPVVRADALHLTNIINNLLDNANKYSPDQPCITVSTMNDKGRLVIRVADNGIGIPEEHVQKVFDKFYRVPTGNRHDVKGFGLGLSYVKLMTEAMGGTVRLKSSPGKGTSVELEFMVETVQ